MLRLVVLADIPAFSRVVRHFSMPMAVMSVSGLSSMAGNADRMAAARSFPLLVFATSQSE